MRIQLPNPNDYYGKEDQFFEQLELCIYHARKAWEKTVKTYPTVENGELPWIAFKHERWIENALDVAKDEDGEFIDPYYEDRQQILLAIEVP